MRVRLSGGGRRGSGLKPQKRRANFAYLPDVILRGKCAHHGVHLQPHARQQPRPARVPALDPVQPRVAHTLVLGLQVQRVAALHERSAEAEMMVVCLAETDLEVHVEACPQSLAALR